MSASLIQHHAMLLKDTVRMNAYKKAIECVVKEGDVVIDIGCGLGILSFLALKAGSAHVHAVEVEPNTLKLARIIAKENGLDKRITFHKGLSYKLKLKEKADVIISEIFGNIALNENLLPAMLDAKDRLLKDGGKMIPSAVKIWLSPCENKDWEFTAKRLHDCMGFDLLPDAPEFDLGVPSTIVETPELLSNSAVFADIDIMNISSDSVSNHLTFEVAKDGVLTGFAGWFDAKLADGVTFATNPSGLTTHWKQGFLPLRSPQRVKAGQKITLTLEISPDLSGLNSQIGYEFEVVV